MMRFFTFPSWFRATGSVAFGPGDEARDPREEASIVGGDRGLALASGAGGGGEEPPQPRLGRPPAGAGELGRAVPPGQLLLLVGFLLVIGVMIAFAYLRGGGDRVPYSFFRAQLMDIPGNVETIRFSEEKITGDWKE